MNDALKIIVGALAALLGKIVFDWLKPKNGNGLEEKIEKIITRRLGEESPISFQLRMINDQLKSISESLITLMRRR